MNSHSHRLVSGVKQHGFSMIEILITLVIVAIALLGTAGLQVYAMRVGQSGQFRTQAVFLAADIAERMEANKQGAINGGYAMGLTTAAPALSNVCISGPCNSSALRDYDLNQWSNSVASLLPQASWKIDSTITGNPNTYSIVVSWTDRRTDTKYGANNAASSFGINAAGTGERFSYTATRTVSN